MRRGRFREVQDARFPMLRRERIATHNAEDAGAEARCSREWKADAVGAHYVKTSNRSRIICNGPLTPVTCTHICNDCYLVPVTDKRDRSTPGLASATPVTNVDFW
jgi:hypothetical protein